MTGGLNGEGGVPAFPLPLPFVPCDECLRQQFLTVLESSLADFLTFAPNEQPKKGGKRVVDSQDLGGEEQKSAGGTDAPGPDAAAAPVTGNGVPYVY